MLIKNIANTDTIMSFSRGMFDAILVKLNTDYTISLMYATRASSSGTYTTIGTLTTTFNNKNYNDCNDMTKPG